MKNISVEMLLDQFPPYQGKYITIKKNQQVLDDIIPEILNAHEEFKNDYDRIGLFFDDTTTDRICKNIYSFLKKNIKYKKENDKDQTTKLPAGILTLRQGDCKHYASFSGGILDALNRAGYQIQWSYRFASYRFLERTPYHVYVQVYDENGQDIPIDPTPGAEGMIPVWLIEKTNCIELIEK